MSTGRLSISRGHQVGAGAPPAPRLALVPRTTDQPKPRAAPAPAADPAPVPPEYHFTHERLAALERLARLHKQGVLSVEEFAVEKALILKVPAGELVLRDALPADASAARQATAARGPSLLGRLFSWKFVSVGFAAGVGLSFASQPQETLRFFDEALRLFGG